MILQSLDQYYTRLEDDPEIDVAPFGFSRQKIAFRVNLNSDGSLHGIEDVRRQEGSNLVPVAMIVPGGAKPSGAGINPNFLWDNAAYMLGFKPDDPKPERTAQSFAAFKKRHCDLEEEIGDDEFSAVCRFLATWDPARASDFPFLAELTSGFGVFRLRAAQHHVHDRDKVLAHWRRQLNPGDDHEQAAVGQCLISGDTTVLARLHEPKIKGVMGAQTSGAAIVSFNLDAFESYGKLQSFNAPVGQMSAFRYATALNHLLRAGSKQRLQIGDATTVFWTEKPTAAEQFMSFVFDTGAAEDEGLRTQLHTLLSQISSGNYPHELGDPNTAFFVLGLSPNASRLSVRFWHESTLRDIVTQLAKHFDDLAIDRTQRDPPFPALWQILRETARESKDIPPLLSGALMRAVLSGTPYPNSLYGAVLRRIRADRQVRYLRAAILKACLNRNTRHRINPLQKELPMSLDPDRPEPAYHMGRLFAALEKAQEDALPGINDTIKDRYFGAASATPASVFPRLIRLSQHHLGKLEKPSRIYHEKRIQEICQRIDSFRPHLNLQDQGLFAIGYYHQRQDIFSKKTDSNSIQEQE